MLGGLFYVYFSCSSTDVELWFVRFSRPPHHNEQGKGGRGGIQGGYKGEGGSQGVYRRKEGRGAGQEELNGQVSVDLSRAYKHQA